MYYVRCIEHGFNKHFLGFFDVGLVRDKKVKPSPYDFVMGMILNDIVGDSPIGNDYDAMKSCQ